MKAFADDKSSDGKIVNLPICQGRKYCGKRRKILVASISPFIHNVFKGLPNGR